MREIERGEERLDHLAPRGDQAGREDEEGELLRALVAQRLPHVALADVLLETLEAVQGDALEREDAPGDLVGDLVVLAGGQDEGVDFGAREAAEDLVWLHRCRDGG